MKKYLCLVLILFSCYSFYSQTATRPNGSGNYNDPYLISNLEELYWIATSINNWGYSRHYRQVKDIDASPTQGWFNGQGWTPLGTKDHPFRASYDGMGHHIYGLHINRPNTDRVGFLGNVSYDSTTRKISNIGLRNANVTGKNWVGILAGQARECLENCHSTGTVSGNNYVGGLVGENNYSVKKCFSSATVTGNSHVGGLVGYNHSNISPFCCYSSGNVTGSGDRIGGLIGYNYFSYNFQLCYSSGNTHGHGDSVGGLVGEMYYSDIHNCYSFGTVNGDGDYVGGLIGQLRSGSNVYNCYSIAGVSGETAWKGGLIGNYGIQNYVHNSYWNTETSGQSTSGGGEGRNTDEMTYPYSDNTYADWDFYYKWNEDIDYEINNGYPCLFFQELFMIYRFFNIVHGGHLLIADESEKQYIIENLPEWKYEGSKFRTLSDYAPGSARTYRLFNTNTGKHLYTISRIETAYLRDFPQWNYEGAKFDVRSSSDAGTIPVYRFFNHVNGGHLYTASELERDIVMQGQNWIFEGIAFYVYPLENIKTRL